MKNRGFKGIDERLIRCAKDTEGSIQSGISFDSVDGHNVLRFHFLEYEGEILHQATKFMYLNKENTSMLINALGQMNDYSKDELHVLIDRLKIVTEWLSNEKWSSKTYHERFNEWNGKIEELSERIYKLEKLMLSKLDFKMFKFFVKQVVRFEQEWLINEWNIQYRNFKDCFNNYSEDYINSIPIYTIIKDWAIDFYQDSRPETHPYYLK